MSIRFGTSGWRAIIADEFTFDNVRRVTEAICRYLTMDRPAAGRTLVTGFDSRFMGEKFSSVAAELAAARGFRVLLCTGQTPTPAISCAILRQGASGALNFTASHNPPEYQGIKFSTLGGAPALPEVTQKIEAAIESGEVAASEGGGLVEAFDAKPDYLKDLAAKINLTAISEAKGRFAYDALWGTGRGYLDNILRDAGCEVETLNDWRDVTFGGRSPEPGEDHLDELRERVLTKKLTLGIATDGDADRFGIIDSNGAFITPNQLIALLTDYLAESRGWKKGVARSVATSHLVDRVAAERGLKLYGR